MGFANEEKVACAYARNNPLSAVAYCNPSRPVGYIEGWYVAESHRHTGIGRKLLAVAEDWARSQGCVEIASDTWVDNEVSQRVHEALGYEVVDRCVHYRRTL